MANYIPSDSLQLGENLFANPNNEYYSFNKGKRVYTQSPFDAQAKKLNDAANAQKKSQLDALKAQQTQAVKNLKPTYQAQRNQADVVNAQNVSKLRELMAANGINASGENITAQADLASSRQGALSQINSNEAQAIAEINNPAKSQDIINAIEAQRTQALADAYAKGLDQTYNRNQDFLNRQWQQYVFNNISSADRAQIGMSKYGIDANNAASSAASAAELAYYKSLGFPTP